MITFDYALLESEPFLSIQDAPELDLVAGQQIEQAGKELRAGGIQDVPILMTSAYAGGVVEAFPARIRWKKAALSNPLHKYTAGALGVLTVFQNDEDELLWARNKLNPDFDDFWSLSVGSSLDSEHRTFREIAEGINEDRLGIDSSFYTLQPAAFLHCEQTADTLVVYLARIEPDAVLKPGDRIEDLLWADTSRPPSQSLAISHCVQHCIEEIRGSIEW